MYSSRNRRRGEKALCNLHCLLNGNFTKFIINYGELYFIIIITTVQRSIEYNFIISTITILNCDIKYAYINMILRYYSVSRTGIFWEC